MTAENQAAWVGELLDVLDHQRQMYEQLLALSESQSALVAEGDAESLLTLLSQRQAIVDALLESNAQIEPIRAKWSQRWAELDAATQERVRERMDAVQGLLDQIMERDEKDREALSAQRQEVGRQLNQVQQGAAVNKAYGQARFAPAANRFTDREG